MAAKRSGGITALGPWRLRPASWEVSFEGVVLGRVGRVPGGYMAVYGADRARDTFPTRKAACDSLLAAFRAVQPSLLDVAVGG